MKLNTGMTGELNETQMNNILSSQAIGRLACTDGKCPYIIPMTYTFDGNYIYGQTFEGKKLDILRKNPNTCFQVDIHADIYNWQSVIIFGRFEELVGDKSVEARDILFSRVFCSNSLSFKEKICFLLDQRVFFQYSGCKW